MRAVAIAALVALLAARSAAGEPRPDAVELPAGGQLIRVQTRWAGYRVIGGERAIRIDAGGRVRWTAGRDAIDLASLDALPRLSPGRALALAGAPGGTAELVVLAPVLGRPRLAYRVQLPRDLGRAEAIRIDIDAVTGRTLSRRNLVRAALGRVYRENPVATPALEQVELPGLAPGASQLASADVTVFGCPDAGTCREVFAATFLHACEPTALAAPDGSDNFDYDDPGDTELDDEFAEVQAYFHVATAYDALRARGGPGPVAMPLVVLANYKGFDPTSLDACGGTTTYAGTGSLPRFDNALFAPADTPGIGLSADTLILGQGRNLDYAYDGDVVAHELGHAVMRAVAPELSDGFVDELGFDPTPAAMHEAYADMVALFVTGDPVIGDYVMDAIASSGRDLDNDATCPRDLVGLPHPDSLPLTGALYEARTALAGDELAFDRAVFAAQQAFGADSDFGTAAALTVSELELTLGPGAAAQVAEVFERRGIDDCNDRVIDAAESKPLFVLPGGEGEVTPGPFQFRAVVDDTAGELAVDIDLYDVDVVDPALFGATLELKPGDEPIQWSADGDDFTSDATASAPLAVGDDRTAHAAIAGPLPAGIYHLQLVNRGVNARVHGISFSTVTAAGGGCGCSARGSSNRDSALLIALAATLSIARRRRDRGAIQQRHQGRRGP